MNQKFEIIFDNLITLPLMKKNFILGLSGGADSICLLHLLKKYIENNNNINIAPVVVDHGIRKNSEIEAKKVKQYSENLGFKTKIKKIEEKIPKGNIQNWARFYRRNLLIEESVLSNSNLILAHHIDDQIETLFMRLIRGSGFSGMIGMKKITEWGQVKIIRPLLSFKKKDILKYVKENKLFCVNDVSNTNLNYERVYTRRLLSQMEDKSEENTQKLLEKFSHLSFRLLSLIQRKLEYWISYNIKFYDHGSISIDISNLNTLYNISPKFCSLLIGKLINNVGGNTFIPKQKKILIKLSFLFKKKINKFTLGNVILFTKLGKLNMIKEERNLDINNPVKKNKFQYFDNRFILLSKFDGHILNSKKFNLEVVNLASCSKFFQYSNLINNSLPVLKTLEGRLVKPYLSIVDKNKIREIKNFDRDFILFFVKNIDFV